MHVAILNMTGLWQRVAFDVPLAVAARWCFQHWLLACIAFPRASGAPLRGVKFYDFPDVGNIGELPHFTYFVDTEAPYYSEIRKTMQAAARQSSQKRLAFVEIGTQHSDVFKFFNFHSSSADLPVALIVDWTFGMGNKPFKKYPLTKNGGPDAAALRNGSHVEYFVRDFLAGTLQPWSRSEPVEQALGDYNPSDGAMTIVGSQFEEVVVQGDFDVLVMLFAPWCGFSKRMQPLFDHLARQLQHVKTLRIVKMDATMNDITHPIMRQMDGYPFLGFFPAADKDGAQEFGVETGTDEADEWSKAVTSRLKEVATHAIVDAPAQQSLPTQSSSIDRDLEEM